MNVLRGYLDIHMYQLQLERTPLQRMVVRGRVQTWKGLLDDKNPLSPIQVTSYQGKPMDIAIVHVLHRYAHISLYRKFGQTLSIWI